MIDLSEQIKNIQNKLQLLLKQQAVLQKENQRLKNDLQEAVFDNMKKTEALHTIQQQVDVLKMGSSTLLSDAEKNTLNKRIDGYLKEIDQCLALLNT
ncbi:hypothetical protein [Sediminibacterium soli]|uniref:hypothetical protein n=1 Tax=Sediminibacterium soli TaxID=2698829 RepID=UPI00137A9F37|nr:hypothetical protein [Sediminibacterium soli]NCI45463.1 hypothetical protein [Sediminibacterium soli]